jgi:chromosome segregation ATPase
MGRELWSTKEQVFAAADAIAATGENVTLRTLRGYLGGGSFGSLDEPLRQWKAERKQRPEVSDFEMPPAVIASFESTWRIATAEALKDVAAVKEKATAEVEEIEAQRQEVIGLMQDVENERDELRDKLAEVERALSNSESKASLLAIEKATLTGITGELKNKIEQLERNLEKSHHAYEARERQHAEELNRLLGAQSAEISVLKIEMTKLEAACNSAKDEAHKYQERLIVATDEMKATEQKLVGKLDVATQEKDAANKKAYELSGRLEELDRQNKELLAKVKAIPAKEK